MDKLSEGERRFRMLADNAPVLMWRADATMNRDWVNRAWLEFTGRMLEQELGLGWSECIHPDDRDATIEAYTSAFSNGEPYAATYRLRRADGQYRWMLDKGRPNTDADGGVAGCFGSCTDVDDIVKANEALEEAVQERAEAVAQRDHLLHEVQHRVRNNLQLILSIIDIQARSEQRENRKGLGVVAGRVRSIARAQSLLLDPTGKAEIDLAAYVASLASGAPRGAQPVRFRGPADSVQLPLARAVPLGLMINEILAEAVPSDGSADPQGEAPIITLLRDPSELRLEIEAPRPLAKSGNGSGAMPSRLIERLGAQAGARLESTPGEPCKVIVRIRTNQ